MTTNIIVNMLEWYTFTNYVIKAYTSVEGTYVSLERAIVLEQERAKSSTNPTVRVDRVVDTVKDPSSGKKHDKVYYKVTEVHKHYAKNAIKELGKIIDRKSMINNPWLNKLATVEDNNYIAYNKKELVSVPMDTRMAFIVIPQNIPIPKEAKTAIEKSEARKAFFRFTYSIVDKASTYILYRDIDNYIMVYEKKLVTITANGTPGFKLTSNALKSFWAKIIQQQPMDKNTPIICTPIDYTADWCKKYLIDFKLIKNPYYRKLLDVSIRVRSNYILSLINSYSQRGSTNHTIASDVKEYEAVFNMLDFTTPRELHTDIDIYVYKVYTIFNLKIAGVLKEYLPTTYDEYKANAMISLMNKVLKTDIKLGDVLVEEELKIKEDYVMVDGQSVQLKDNMNPHQVYMEEEEASASSLPQIKGEI